MAPKALTNNNPVGRFASAPPSEDEVSPPFANEVRSATGLKLYKYSFGFAQLLSSLKIQLASNEEAGASPASTGA